MKMSSELTNYASQGTLANVKRCYNVVVCMHFYTLNNKNQL
jgi:hypothetical protein